MLEGFIFFFFFSRKKDIFTNMHNVGMIFTEIIRGIKGALCVFEEKKSPKQKNIHNINKVITPQYFCEIFPKADF